MEALHLGSLAASVRDFADYRFLRDALAAGLLIGVLCSALSVFVVLKRMVFVGQGVSHAAFAGVALSLILFDPSGGGGPGGPGGAGGPEGAGFGAPGGAAYAVTALYSLAVAFLMAWAIRRGKMSGDSAIGMFFVVSMALGVLLIASRRAFTADIFGILFGSILSVTRGDVWAAGGLAALAGLALLLFFKEAAYYAFDEEMAELSGLPAGAIHYGFVLLIALAVVVSIRVVGIILVNAFLVIPGLVGLSLAKRLPQAIALSVAAGAGSVAAGLILANHLDAPAGATVVVVLFGVYLASLAGRRLWAA